MQRSNCVFRGRCAKAVPQEWNLHLLQTTEFRSRLTHEQTHTSRRINPLTGGERQVRASALTLALLHLGWQQMQSY